MLFNFTGYISVCFGGANEENEDLQTIKLDKEGERYSLESFPKMALMHNGGKIFLINESGQQIVLMDLGNDDDAEPAAWEHPTILVGDFNYDHNPEFMIQTREGTGGQRYIVVDSAGKNIKKSLFQDDADINNPNFNYKARTMTFLHRNYSDLIHDNADRYEYKDGRYIKTAILLFGNCFHKDMALPEEKTGKASGLIGDSEKPTSLTARITEDVRISQKTDLALAKGDKILKSGSRVIIGDILQVPNGKEIDGIDYGRIVVFVKSAGGNLSGWISGEEQGLFENLRCVDK